jgi:SnoaL-like protein
MDTREAARRWARTWERAWREHDPELLREVYAEGCIFRSSPFREPQDPVEYAAWAFEGEASAEPTFAEPIVDGERAAVPWWTTRTGDDGAEQTIVGCSLLRLGEDGRAVEEHDAWLAVDRHESPFPGWARPDG